MPTPIDFKFYSTAPSICEKTQRNRQAEKKKEARKSIYGITFFLFIVAAAAYVVFINSPTMPVTENTDQLPGITTAELRNEEPI